MAISLSRLGTTVRKRRYSPSFWERLPISGLRRSTLNGPSRLVRIPESRSFTIALCSGASCSNVNGLNRSPRRLSNAMLLGALGVSEISGFKVLRRPRRPDAVRETPDALVDLCRREGAERQPQETLAASLRKEGKTLGKIETTRGGRGPHRGRGHAFGKGQRDEEPAVGARRHGLRHVPVEAGEAGIEAWRVELLQALDLRQQKSAAAPFVRDALRDVARGYVRILGGL